MYAPLVIRRAAPADVEAIRRIRNDAIATTTAIWTSVEHGPGDAELWLSEHLERDSIVVAERGSEVAGFACWGPWRAKEGYRLTVDDSIYIDAGHRGHGLGRMLLEAVVASARGAGKHVMIADIEAGNEASIRLHQNLGFETIGTLSEVGTKFDRWLDLTILRLAL